MQKIRIIIIFIYCLVVVSKTTAQADKILERVWALNFETNMDSAILLTYSAYEIAKQNGDIKSMGRAISYRAIFYDMVGTADSSIFLFHQAIKIQEAINDTVGLVRTYNNMGIFHIGQFQYSKAEIYYKKSYQNAMLLKDYGGAATALMNMGDIEFHINGNNKALKYYIEAERLYLIKKDTAKLVGVWATYAQVYYDQKKYAEALKLIQKTLKYNDLVNSIYGRISNRILLTKILMEMHRYIEAEKYILEALSIANKYKATIERKQYVYSVLSKLYNNKQDYKKALQYTNYYVAIRDSLLTENMARQQAEMEAINGIERKNTEIIKLKLDVEKNQNIQLQKEKLQARFYFILIASGIGLVALIILIVLIFLLRNNLRLEKTNNKLLNDKNKNAESLLEKEKLLMRESHHRIKNNLQLINSILDLQSKTIKDPIIKKTFTESMQRIQAISFAHQRLYGNETVETLNVNGFLSDLINSIRFSSMDDSSKIEIVQDIAEIAVSTEKAIPIGLIINELLTNSIKYAFNGKKQGLITVKLYKLNNNLELLVEDNGCGMEQNNPKIGFGYQLVKSMTRQLRAKYYLSLTNGVKNVFLIPMDG